jgi:hypothetical protein
MGQRNPAPVENGGKHPIIYRISTILLVVQDFTTINSISSLNIIINSICFCHW